MKGYMHGRERESVEMLKPLTLVNGSGNFGNFLRGRFWVISVSLYIFQIF